MLSRVVAQDYQATRITKLQETTMRLCCLFYSYSTGILLCDKDLLCPHLVHCLFLGTKKYSVPSKS